MVPMAMDCRISAAARVRVFIEPLFFIDGDAHQAVDDHLTDGGIVGADFPQEQPTDAAPKSFSLMDQ
jgi:hypothetical protein